MSTPTAVRPSLPSTARKQPAVGPHPPTAYESFFPNGSRCHSRLRRRTQTRCEDSARLRQSARPLSDNRSRLGNAHRTIPPGPWIQKTADARAQSRDRFPEREAVTAHILAESAHPSSPRFPRSDASKNSDDRAATWPYCHAGTHQRGEYPSAPSKSFASQIYAPLLVAA